MGLFGKRKAPEEELPPLQFPELPSTIPPLEPSMGISLGEAQQIKSAVAPSAFPPLPRIEGGEERPLFVKIERYRDAVETLKKLKARLNEADTILTKLTHLRQEEDQELQAWQTDLERIRAQLLEIDQKLFD